MTAQIVGTRGLQPVIPASTVQQIQWATAAGTADNITGAYATPNTALTDGLILGFRASAANATTTPLFSPDALTAAVITKAGGAPLLVGDIPGALAEELVRYNLAHTRWELLNPVVSLTITSGLVGPPVLKSTAFPILNSDKGHTFVAGGSAYYTITVGAAIGFDSDFQARVTNQDAGRGKLMSINGVTPFILLPGQTITLINEGGVWVYTPSFQRWAGSPTFRVSTTGSDSNDGLGTGAGAFLTINHAYLFIKQWVDLAGGGAASIQIEDGSYDVGAGVVMTYALVGGNQLNITGNTTTPSNVQITCNPGAFCFFGRDGCGTATLQGFRLKTIGNGSNGIYNSQFFQIDWGKIEFHDFPSGVHIQLQDIGSNDIVDNYAVTATIGMAIHIVCTGQSKLNYGTYSINVVNAITFSTWLSYDSLAYVNAGGVALSFTGTGAGAGSTGQKYSGSANSVAHMSATGFPGGTAGAVATGAIFS